MKRDIIVRKGTYIEMMQRLRDKLGDVQFTHELRIVEGEFAYFVITYTF